MSRNEKMLVRALSNTKVLLDVACKNFELSGNDELSDYYSYQIKALKIQYDYLLKQAKKEGIILSVVKRLDIKYKDMSA